MSHGSVLDSEEFERERRRQRRIDRLGTSNPACVVCGQDDDRCLELHHLAGRAYEDTTCIVCSNCHRKLSDAQRDHPVANARQPSEQERIGRFLLGLSDLCSLLAERLRSFGNTLIDACRADDPPAPD